jgi:hypothetical protein
MTTDQAFEEMIHLRGIHNDLGVTQKLVSAYRQHLKNGRGIKIETKMILLQKAGYNLIQEPKWQKP